MSQEPVFHCDPHNDLYRALADAGHAAPRYASLDEALTRAPRAAAVLSLADGYPRASQEVTAAQLSEARTRGLKLYLEYPAAIEGLDLGEPRPTQWERAVVASDFFGPDLEAGRILALHGCWYLPAEAPSSHLVVARVAGYHRAVYGLPDDAAPVLFELPGEPVLVAATGLSHFVTARYGPRPAWRIIWQRILQWLQPDEPVLDLTWTPAVELTAGPQDELLAEAEADAFERSIGWFRDQVVYSIDWKKGAIEGFEAGIDHRGRQLKRTWPRGDCIGETAMVFAWDWAVTGDPASRQRAGQLLDYVYSAPDFYHDDPADPAYGHTNWFERGGAFYGDDNARVLMPALTAARLVGEDRWDECILRCVLANLRTTGTLGFRRPRLNLEQFHEHGGWSFFHDEAHVHYAPHYQAYLWATFLWVHALTGDEELLAKPKNAIRMTMEAYPDGWKWTNGIAQEIARMLLPLSFLVRVEDTPEHRQWLQRMANELLSLVQPCGAIREDLGDLEKGSYGPPNTNEAYGTSEAPLIQENGDPACDLLYTTNYAFLGLHEAAAATRHPGLREAADHLAAFLCRIQVRSTAQPYLDGAWMRAFDYELWEYWGSSADLGWGAWSVESGWTNTWIASVLAMRQQGQTLFDTSLRERLSAQWPALREDMLPGAGEGDRATQGNAVLESSSAGAEVSPISGQDG